MLMEANRGGSDEVGYPEFLEIMTSTLNKMSEESEAATLPGKPASAQAGIPFSLMATAYRRKRLMEGLITRDRDMQAQIALLADELMEDSGDAGKLLSSSMQSTTDMCTLFCCSSPKMFLISQTNFFHHMLSITLSIT